MASVPEKYIPQSLTKKDKLKQKTQLKKSRSDYKRNKYHTRKKVTSFTSKVSPHILKAISTYNVTRVLPNKKLSKAKKCSISSLQKIVKKGQGAYFSSGSRPNQTGHSWGIARLASAITGGKASVVDINILKKGCKKNSKALKFAKKASKQKTQKVKKIKL